MDKALKYDFLSLQKLTTCTSNRAYKGNNAVEIDD